MERSVLGLYGQQRRLFACDCVEHKLAVFEKAFPDDDRPRDAIMVARRFVFGIAPGSELRETHATMVAAVRKISSKAPAEFRENWPPALVAEAALICCAPDNGSVDPAEVCRYMLSAIEASGGQALKEHRWQYGRLLWYLKQSASKTYQYHGR